MSSAYTSTYRQSDGTLSADIYTEPVNYQDDQTSDWTPIDNTLVPAPGAQYDVQNAANAFTAKIPEDPTTTPVRIQQDGSWVTLRMHGLEPGSADIDDTTATFGGVDQADSVSYEAVNTGLKESVTLDAAPANPVAYTYTVDASADLTASLRDGAVVFTQPSGAVAFALPAGTMSDADSATSDAVTYALEKRDGGWTLTVTPDYQWLTAPDRAYPVTIDPTLATVTDNLDCWLASSSPDGTHCSNNTLFLKAGRSDASHTFRSLVRFNASDLPSNADVSQATVHMYLDQTQTESASNSPSYAFYTPGKSWDSNASWNTSGASGSWTGGSPGSAAYSQHDWSGSSGGDKAFVGFGDLVQQWINADIPNRGLVFKQVSENTNNVLYFYSNSSQNPSTKKPYLNVTYTTHPSLTALALTPCDTVCDPSQRFTSSLTPTLSTTWSDLDSTSLNYTWQIRDAMSQVSVGSGATTGSQGAPSAWTVPSGTLVNDSLYEFRVGASDGTVTYWSSWQLMSVETSTAPSAPTDLSLSPCVGDDCSTLATTSLTPTLTAKVVDDDDVAADFQVRTATTHATVASGVAVTYDPASFQVPPGALSSGSNYEFRVGADSQGVASWSDWTSFQVQAPLGPPEPSNFALQGCVQPCAAWVAASATPTFSATAPQGATDVVFQVASSKLVVPGVVHPVTAGTTASWTVPAGTLGGNDYLVRVGATNAAGAATWSSWHTVSVDPSVATSDSAALDGSAADSDTDPVDHFDSALDAADTGTSTFTESDLDAIDAQVASDEADSQSRGLNPDDPASARAGAVPFPVKWGPKAWLNQNESYWPISAFTMTNHSELTFAHDDTCNDSDKLRDPGPAPLAGTHISDQQEYPPALLCHRHGTVYHPSTPHVAVDDDGGPGGREGFFLNLDTVIHDGLGFSGLENIYYYFNESTRSNEQNFDYIQYWYPYAYNAPPARPYGDHHEGDWEHVTILFNAGFHPSWVDYGFHGHSCKLRWANAPKKNTHVKLWIARGTHGLYPPNAKPYHDSRFAYTDSLSDAGDKIWYSNSNTIRYVTDEPWWGYYGNWGEIGTKAVGWINVARTGPTGPSPIKNSEPNWAKAPMCTKADGSAY